MELKVEAEGGSIHRPRPGVHSTSISRTEGASLPDPDVKLEKPSNLGRRPLVVHNLYCDCSASVFLEIGRRRRASIACMHAAAA